MRAKGTKPGSNEGGCKLEISVGELSHEEPDCDSPSCRLGSQTWMNTVLDINCVMIPWLSPDI